MDKTALTEQQQFYRCSQSAQLSTYDSGFVDEQTMGSLTAGNTCGGSESNLVNEQKDQHMSMDDILLTKSEEDDDDDDLLSNGLTINDARQSNRQKWRHISKRVSFQG
jgi:hypothetical protein